MVRWTGMIFCGAMLLLTTAWPLRAGEPVRWNSPPNERLDEFDRFELLRLAVGTAKAKDEVVERLQSNLQKEIGEWAGEKNAMPARRDPPRILKIEPVLEDVRMVGTGGRIWLGPMLGRSRVLLRLRLIDADNGRTIAEPEFYQRTGAWSGGTTLGVMDKAMLVRVVRLSVDYLAANYSASAGGAMTDDDESAAARSQYVEDEPGGRSSSAAATLANGASPEWTYAGDPEETARNLALSRNCNGKFSVVGKGADGAAYSATCWGGRQLKIACSQGTCRIGQP